VYQPAPRCQLFVGEYTAAAIPYWDWGYPHCTMKAHAKTREFSMPVLSIFDFRQGHSSFYHVQTEVASRLAVAIYLLQGKSNSTLVKELGQNYRFLMPTPLTYHVKLLQRVFPEILADHHMIWFGSPEKKNEEVVQLRFKRFYTLDWEPNIKPYDFLVDGPGGGLKSQLLAAGLDGGSRRLKPKPKKRRRKKPRKDRLHTVTQEFSLFDKPVWDLHCPPREALLLQRKYFRRSVPMSPDSHPTPHVVWYSRADVDKRHITNEIDAIRKLRHRLGGDDHVSVFQGGITPDPERAIKIFGSADVIIGPHGGGLMNMIFSKAATTVIIFPTIDAISAPSGFDQYFSHACAALGMEYVLMPGPVAEFYSNYTLDSTHIQMIESKVMGSLIRRGLIQKDWSDRMLLEAALEMSEL